MHDSLPICYQCDTPWWPSEAMRRSCDYLVACWVQLLRCSIRIGMHRLSGVVKWILPFGPDLENGRSFLVVGIYLGSARVTLTLLVI
jgi:hypothetical protein